MLTYVLSIKGLINDNQILAYKTHKIANKFFYSIIAPTCLGGWFSYIFLFGLGPLSFIPSLEGE